LGDTIYAIQILAGTLQITCCTTTANPDRGLPVLVWPREGELSAHEAGSSKFVAMLPRESGHWNSRLIVLREKSSCPKAGRTIMRQPAN